MRSLHRHLVVGVVVALVICPNVALAVPVVFTVDPARSTFTMGGTFNGIKLAAQTPGSSTVGYTGALNVDIDRALGTLTFPSVTVDAENQHVDQQPFTESQSAANYGFRTTGAANPQTLLAVRGMDLYLRADNAPFNTAAPPSNDAFGFFVNGGTLHLRTSAGLTGGADLHGTGGSKPAGPITLTTVGNVETLTIPIQTIMSPGTDAPNEIELTLAGQVVATRAVPEPGMVGVLACVGTGTSLRRRRS